MDELELTRLQEAKHTAYRLIEIAPRSTAEIRSRLKLKRFSGEVIDRVVREFEAQDFLDDRKYARIVVERGRSVKPQGKRALYTELKRKGLGDAMISAALEGFSQEDEARLALEASERRFRYRTFKSPKDKKQKVFEFLKRRGFDFQIAMDVAKKLEEIGPSLRSG